MECRLRPKHPPHSRLLVLELEHPGGTQHPRYGEPCPCPSVPHSAALLQGFPSSGRPNTSFSQPSRAEQPLHPTLLKVQRCCEPTAAEGGLAETQRLSWPGQRASYVLQRRTGRSRPRPVSNIHNSYNRPHPQNEDSRQTQRPFLEKPLHLPD